MTVDFKQLAWAAFITKVNSGKKDLYMDLYRDIQFRNSLITNPTNLDMAVLKKKVFHDFLNNPGWGARYHWTSKRETDIKKTLVNLQPFFQLLDNKYSLIDVNFETPVKLMAGDRLIAEHTLADIIAVIFNSLDNIDGFAGTITTKFMAIINPSLFIMMDKPIYSRYKISQDGVGYVDFLRQMQVTAKHYVEDFRKYNIAGFDDPALYLSEKLSYNPPKTLAKFLDEYNWLSITKECEFPPAWHPCDI